MGGPFGGTSQPERKQLNFLCLALPAPSKVCPPSSSLNFMRFPRESNAIRTDCLDQCDKADPWCQRVLSQANACLKAVCEQLAVTHFVALAYHALTTGGPGATKCIHQRSKASLMRRRHFCTSVRRNKTKSEQILPPVMLIIAICLAMLTMQVRFA